MQRRCQLYARLPGTINSAREARTHARRERVFGKGNVITEHEPTMGGEDFSYMLQRAPAPMFFSARAARQGVVFSTIRTTISTTR